MFLPAKKRREKLMKRWLRFNVVIWCVAIAALFWLVAVPPLMDFWAAAHWNKIPCHISPDAAAPDRYFYEISGAQYNSQRRDFWRRKGILDKRNHPMTLEPNEFCWANPSDPEDTVLKLDAHTNFSNAGGHFAAASLLIVAAFVVTYLGSRKKK
jgi:hypothetical protein